MASPKKEKEEAKGKRKYDKSARDKNGPLQAGQRKARFRRAFVFSFLDEFG